MVGQSQMIILLISGAICGLLILLCAGAYYVLVFNLLELRKKQQLKAVDLKIVAAENGLKYEQLGYDGTFFERLKFLGLLPNGSSAIKNILSQKINGVEFHLFETCHSMEGEFRQYEKINATEHMIHNPQVTFTGFAVTIDTLHVPQFEIQPQNGLGKSDWVSTLNTVDKKLRPDWIKAGYSLILGNYARPDQITSLLADKSELTELLTLPNFSMLVGCRNVLVLYQKGGASVIKNTADFLQAKSHALRLASIFDPSFTSAKHADLPQDIQLLKRSNL